MTGRIGYQMVLESIRRDLELVHGGDAVANLMTRMPDPAVTELVRLAPEIVARNPHTRHFDLCEAAKALGVDATPDDIVLLTQLVK